MGSCRHWRRLKHQRRCFVFGAFHSHIFSIGSINTTIPMHSTAAQCSEQNCFVYWKVGKWNMSWLADAGIIPDEGNFIFNSKRISIVMKLARPLGIEPSQSALETNSPTLEHWAVMKLGWSEQVARIAERGMKPSLSVFPPLCCQHTNSI